MRIKLLLLSVALVATCAFVSCSQKSRNVDDVAEAAKKALAVPCQLIDGFTVSDITGEGSNLTLDCTIGDDYILSLFKNPDYMKMSIIYMAQQDNFKPVVDLLKSNGLGIVFKAKDAQGSAVNEIALSVADLESPVDKGVVVRATATAESMSCPMDLGDDRTLVSAEPDGDDTIVYTIECGDSYLNTDFVSIEEVMKRNMVNSMADADTKKQRKELGVYYKYIYKHGDKVLHTLTITPQDWMLY